MQRGVVARWAVVVLVVAVPLLPLALPADHERSVRSGAPIESLASRLNIDDGEAADTDAPVDRDVAVVVELKNGATVPRDQFDVDEVYSRQGARQIRGTVPLTRVRELSRDPRIKAVRIERERVGVDGRTAAGVAAVGADELHAQGVTGENVTVGIIDRGFRPGDPEIAGSVGAYRAFDTDDDDWVHGTAVASIVVDTAPNATLHLAAVGPSTTPGEYQEVIDWFEASGADVIVDAGSYFGQPGDGSGELARVASNASEHAVFVAAAGNYAQRHWTGVHEGTGEREWVRFGDTEGNALGNGSVSGPVSVSLHWDERPTRADYDLYLMRQRPGDDAVVAHSKVRQEDDEPSVERVDATVPRGRYYVAVRAYDVAATRELELFATHELSVATANGSVTVPGTARGVLTVGAYSDGEVKPFSSRGPVGNGTGVDLVAPDSVAASRVDSGEGTSYAAPYVAGTAALLASQYPELTPAELRTVLWSSSNDIGPPGPDSASGWGVLDAQGAYALADERTQDAADDESDAAENESRTPTGTSPTPVEESRG